MSIGDQKPRSYRDVTNNGLNNQSGYEGRNHSMKESQRAPRKREAYVEKRNQDAEGNRRSECPNIKFKRCDKNGHYKENCRTDLDRMDRMKMDKDKEKFMGQADIIKAQTKTTKVKTEIIKGRTDTIKGQTKTIKGMTEIK